MCDVGRLSEIFARIENLIKLYSTLQYRARCLFLNIVDNEWRVVVNI